MSTSTQEIDRTDAVRSTFRLTFRTNSGWHTVYVRPVDTPANDGYRTVVLLTETAKLEAVA